MATYIRKNFEQNVNNEQDTPTMQNGAQRGAELGQVPAAKPARMRTIPQALKELKAQDPNTMVTENALRTWVRKGYIPFVKAGKNHLLNMDALEKYLSCGDNA